MSAAEAGALLYRPGGLEHLAQLRTRGVLGSPDLLRKVQPRK
ncbi:hypothetical protein [Streptomyces malaysiensis]|uniref:Uncharacterized protein n=1 Tax=Streptomyces malaysiensis subsp. samsunensis TaxID=459658 RepID=A0A9X2M684_STRMQ|nr:hypothetical protein [Streptomyces samsunensis]MCQ8835823.1 hypothetical protein [Streptomyces samsunensis]